MVKRLRDSKENHMGQKGILWCSLVPKRSKIGQEMAELWSRGCVTPLRTTWEKGGSLSVHLYQKDLKSVKKWLSYGQEVAWFHWEPHGTKGDPWALICTNNIKNWSINGLVMAIFPLRGCVIPLRTTCDKRDSWVFICTKNIQNRLRNGWVMAIFPLRGCVIPLRTTWDKRGCLGIHLYQKYPKSVKIWLSYCHFSLKGCVILLKITWDKSGSFRFIFTKNIQNRSRNGLF